MKSMTGYGRHEARSGDAHVSVEIKGYNNRFLEISLNAPPFFAPLEARVRERLAALCLRGSVEVHIRCREPEAAPVVTVNAAAARAYYEAALGLARGLGLAETPALAGILAADGVLSVEHNHDAEAAWALVSPSLEAAALAFDGERRREGAHTLAAILAELAALEAAVARVSAFRAAMDEKLRAAVESRFRELLGNGYDETRVLSEVAALLVKWTIAEELSRLGAHLAEFRAAAAGDGAVGKKLDFLCQEINREINTLGSKASMIEVAREIVPAKNALENIREQLRNIE